MTVIFDAVRRHQLLSFFILALAFTSIAFLPWYMSNGEAIPWFTFGPMIAGLTISAIAAGWPGVRHNLAATIRWRVHPHWYAVAIGLPITAQLIAITLNPVLGSAQPDWNKVPPLLGILPMVALYAVFSGPLGEEPGWRGFALPRLLKRYGALNGSLILGIVWAIWHLPLALVGDFTLHGTVSVLLAAIVFTWLFQNTSGSVLLAILMHASHQNSVRYLGKVFEGSDAVKQQWLGVAIWGVIILGIFLEYGFTKFKSEPAARIVNA